MPVTIWGSCAAHTSTFEPHRWCCLATKFQLVAIGAILLVAIGGPGGLEGCLASDKRLQKSTVTDVFDVILNTCPGGGSRSVRGEEAALVSMGFLQTAVGRFGER